MSEYLDQLNVLLTQENTSYSISDYLSAESSRNSSSFWTRSARKKNAAIASRKRWREKTGEWVAQVADFFNFHIEVVTISLNILDLYMATFIKIDEVEMDEFLLAALTSLGIAVKLNDPRTFTMGEAESTLAMILKLSEKPFTLAQMEQMEVAILQRLQWHVHPPTPLVFMKLYFDIISLKDDDVYQRAKCYVEAGATNYDQSVKFKPSEIALAALISGMEETNAPLHPLSCLDDIPVVKDIFSVFSVRVASCRNQMDRRNKRESDALEQLPYQSPKKKATITGFCACSPTSIISVREPSEV